MIYQLPNDATVHWVGELEDLDPLLSVFHDGVVPLKDNYPVCDPEHPGDLFYRVDGDRLLWKQAEDLYTFVWDGFDPYHFVATAYYDNWIDGHHIETSRFARLRCAVTVLPALA